MMKLGTFIPYLKKIQKTYKSCDAALEFSASTFFHQKLPTFAKSTNTDIDSILIHNY